MDAAMVGVCRPLIDMHRMQTVTLEALRRFAIARSLFKPVSLKQALDKLGFVQADPLRAPARAQDLILRHRVTSYHAGDLERRYATLGIEEDVFVNYGFVSRAVHELMHPRDASARWRRPPRTHAERILEFVRERGEVHPREVDAHFAHGTVTNYWGGSSNATTHLLDDLHYRGLVRVTRRVRGVRLYAVRERQPTEIVRGAAADRLDALVDVVVNIYAPLPGASLSMTVRRLRYAVPQWRRRIEAALARAKRRLGHARVEGVDWYWPAGESPLAAAGDQPLRLLAPFDPLVWDRRRFELFWGWAYRFEAYTPVAKRRFGHYALPLLWRDQVIGWGNLSVADGGLHALLGYVGPPPRDRAFTRGLEEELERIRSFLGLGSQAAARPSE